MFPLVKYGGLAGLLRADFGELCNEHGLGVAKVAQIKAALEIGRRLALTQSDDRPRITAPGDVYTLVGVEMAGLAQEQLRVLLLDTKNGVVHIHTVYQGSPSHIMLQMGRKKNERWSRDYDACLSCDNTKVEHHSHGLCRRCYRRKKANHLPYGSWSLNYTACIGCGTVSSPHKGHGLCNQCYIRQYRSLN